MPTCALGVFMIASAARARLPFAHSVIRLMSRLTLRPMIASIRATDSFTVTSTCLLEGAGLVLPGFFGSPYMIVDLFGGWRPCFVASEDRHAPTPELIQG